MSSAAAAAAGGRSYYSSLSPIRQQSKRPPATRGSGSSCGGYAPVDITDQSGNDDEDDTPSLSYETVVPVANVTAARHNILSFAFLTLVTLSAVIRFVPLTIISQRILYDLTNRQYFALPLAMLNTSGTFSAYLLLRTTNNLTHLSASCWPNKRVGNRSCQLLFVVMLCTELSFLFHGIYVHKMFAAFRGNFFIEPDRTVAIEWRDLEKTFLHAAFWSAVLATLDICVVLLGLAMLWLGKEDNGSGFHLLPSIVYRKIFRGFSISEYSYDIMESRWLCNVYRRLALLCLLASLPFLASAAYSAYIYLPTRNPPPGSNTGPYCDPVDDSECLMPFPSSFFTRRDNTTDTGRRVSISLEALSTMYKGGGPEHPSFLNDLDGFSTGGPIVFYIEGLKEGGGMGANGSKLPDPDHIEISLTSQSITLLLDVDMQVLTAHWSEFDQIDPHRPSVVMQPAMPLKHNTTYAVAIVNALDMEGNVLAPSEGLVSLLNLNESAVPTEANKRSIYYRDTVIPALKGAAPWLRSTESEIQLLFDFHTASATSQLGVARTVRDKTMQQLKSSTWGSWSDHIRVIRTVNGRCRRPTHRVARLVHAEVDVPWYLTIDSPRHRASFIDQRALYGDQTPVEPVKFVVLIPCSLVGRGANSTNLTAVIDFGHSFLYSRQQLIDSSFLHKMANDNGYVMVATNWRGMSRLDLPVILRTFVAEPNLFQAARDNLIQGYAAKMTIQLFCRQALLDMDFMKFRPPHAFQRNNLTEPRYIFFGTSQGGIVSCRLCEEADFGESDTCTIIFELD